MKENKTICKCYFSSYCFLDNSVFQQFGACECCKNYSILWYWYGTGTIGICWSKYFGAQEGKHLFVTCCLNVNIFWTLLHAWNNKNSSYSFCSPFSTNMNIKTLQPGFPIRGRLVGEHLSKMKTFVRKIRKV